MPSTNASILPVGALKTTEPALPKLTLVFIVSILMFHNLLSIDTLPEFPDYKEEFSSPVDMSAPAVKKIFPEAV